MALPDVFAYFVNYLHTDPICALFLALMNKFSLHRIFYLSFFKGAFLPLFCAFIPGGLFSQQITTAEPFLDETKMNHVRQLVDLSMNDSLAANAGELEIMKKSEDQQERLRLESIRTEPGLGPYLVALAGKATVENSSELPGVFQAMSLRQDVDPVVIQSYIEKARLLIESNPEIFKKYESGLIMGIPYLLAMNATSENEEILIKLIKLGERNKYADCVDVASEALSQIGTARSLSAMQEALRWIKMNCDDASRPQFTARMERYLASLRKRILSTGGAR